MANTPEQLQRIFEAALFAAGRPLTIADMQKLFDDADQPEAKEIRAILETLQEVYADRVIELREVASGFQFQARNEFSPWLSRLWEERAPRYSRALLETLSLMAYRQPITRAEIEEIRGVTVSTNIIKTLQDREWIRVVGYRDVPGKPALYATTKTFLDHLGLKSLTELPPLSELADVDSQAERLQGELDFANGDPENAPVTVAAPEEEHETIEATEDQDLEVKDLAEEEHTAEITAVDEHEPVDTTEDQDLEDEVTETEVEDLVEEEVSEEFSPVEMDTAESHLSPPEEDSTHEFSGSE